MVSCAPDNFMGSRSRSVSTTRNTRLLYTRRELNMCGTSILSFFFFFFLNHFITNTRVHNTIHMLEYPHRVLSVPPQSVSWMCSVPTTHILDSTTAHNLICSATNWRRSRGVFAAQIVKHHFDISHGGMLNTDERSYTRVQRNATQTRKNARTEAEQQLEKEWMRWVCKQQGNPFTRLAPSPYHNIYRLCFILSTISLY